MFLWDDELHDLKRYDWKMADLQGICFAADGLRCAAVDSKGKVVVWDVDV